jgi:hypothetical protein
VSSQNEPKGYPGGMDFDSRRGPAVHHNELRPNRDCGTEFHSEHEKSRSQAMEYADGQSGYGPGENGYGTSWDL